MCLLDSGSGAALSVRTWLETLAAAGYRCEALSMALFDGDHEYPLAREVGTEAAAEQNRGKLLQLDRDGVRHTIYYTGSTTGSRLTAEEQRYFLEQARKVLDKKHPAVVVTYGSSAYSRRLRELARPRCGKLVFYLANAEFRDRDYFDDADLVICPSEFLARHYREAFGLEPEVLRTVVRPEHFLEPGAGGRIDTVSRRAGLVTFVNPQPPKGLTLFLRLVQLAWQERPDLTFLAVEGRLSREQLRQSGIDPGAMPNVWWLPNQSDMRRVLARTSLLLFPSFWQEAAGRLVVEAQLSGIPVLAADRGGIVEQLNGGGFLFDLPERCTDDYHQVPTADETRPWLETIGRLMDDEGAYSRAATAAKEAAEPFLWQRRREEVVRFFGPLLNS